MFIEDFKTYSDEDLVAHFSTRSDRRYLAELYVRYSAMVYGTCMKYLKNSELAKDATMDVFEKLIDDLPRFQIQHFKSWLYMVVKNHCFQVLRVKQSFDTIEDFESGANDSFVEFQQKSHLDEIDNINEDQILLMERSLNELDISQSQCLRLFYLQRKTYSEISESTGYSFNEVKSHIQNGKRNLKIKLSKLFASLMLLLFIHIR